MEPALKILFSLVKQGQIKNEELSEKIANQAKILIEALADIQRLEKEKAARYQQLSETLQHEIKLVCADNLLDIRDKAGFPALLYAAANGHTEIVGHLLENKANPNLSHEKWGKTPLMYAIKNGHTDICIMLLRVGTTIDNISREGKTSLEYALENGNLCIISLLLWSHQAQVKNPQALFEFLKACDPHHPDVLLSLRALYEQQCYFRELKLTDEERLVLTLLNQNQFEELEKYYNQRSHEDFIYRQSNSSTLFNEKRSPSPTQQAENPPGEVSSPYSYNAVFNVMKTMLPQFSRTITDKQIRDFTKNFTEEYISSGNVKDTLLAILSEVTIESKSTIDQIVATLEEALTNVTPHQAPALAP